MSELLEHNRLPSADLSDRTDSVLSTTNTHQGRGLNDMYHTELTTAIDTDAISSSTPNDSQTKQRPFSYDDGAKEGSDMAAEQHEKNDGVLKLQKNQKERNLYELQLRPIRKQIKLNSQ